LHPTTTLLLKDNEFHIYDYDVESILPKPFIIQMPTPPKHAINIQLKLIQVIFNARNALSLNAGNVEKLILDWNPAPDPEQSQNAIKCSLSEGRPT